MTPGRPRESRRRRNQCPARTGRRSRGPPRPCRGSPQGRLLSVSAWTPVATSTVAAATVPPAKTALTRRRRGRGQRDGHDFGVDLLIDRLTFGRHLLDRRLAAQVEPALAVDL